MSWGPTGLPKGTDEVKTSANQIKSTMAEASAVAWEQSYAHTNDDEEAAELLSDDDANFLDLVVTQATALWRHQGLPVITMGHQVARDLMMTTVDPEVVDEVHAPWRSFLIEVPPDVLVLPDGASVVVVHVATFTMANGDTNWSWVAYGNDSESRSLWTMSCGWKALAERDRGNTRDAFAELDQEAAAILTRATHLIDALVLNAALAATDRGGSGPGGSLSRMESGGAKPKRWEKPKPKLATYVLGTPVHINLRTDEQKRVVADCFRNYVQYGRASTTREGIGVHYIRMGHVRNQACGPRWSQRRRIWIAPHPVGSSEAPRVLRPHVLVQPAA